ncbi:MAG TPA: lytic transglycosylase domain-containing protein [Thermoanaerobaculia bacterium]|nr:lytic transglycosylase domain-containing protein [Thermoanaerobaculia bacterium]
MACAAAVSAPAAAQAADPRPRLLEQQREGNLEAALETIDHLLAEEPAAARGLALHLLAGDLHHQLGRHGKASAAFMHGFEGGSELATYARYRAAAEQLELGHPEVAAGLVASVVAEPTDTALLPEAVRLLTTSVLAGGDCRLLRNLVPERYGDAERRRLKRTRADCLLRQGTAGAALDEYLELLREKVDDEPAREAAERAAALVTSPPAEMAILLGRTFYQHRDFPRAIAYLAPVVASYEGPLGGERFELAYTLVRSRFWQESYHQAAAGYSALAARARDRRLEARALYQQGRSLELAGEWGDAAAAYRLAYRADPTGGSAEGALIAAMRIAWRTGHEAEALELLELLTARREWTAVAARAGLFLAASDIVQGRTDRAATWLGLAERAGSDTELEVAYWRGRMAELDGDPDEAVRRYLRVQRLDDNHPLAMDVRDRLAASPLAAPARRLAATQRRGGDLYGAWLLLHGEPQNRAEVAHALARRLAADPVSRPWVTLAPLPTAEWPLWRGRLDDPREKLLALGLWDGAGAAVNRHFPLDEPAPALTSSDFLAERGDINRSLLRAEILLRRLPDRVPAPFLSADLLRRLYPLAFPALVREESARHGVDPFLLAAIMREESRYDPRALSGASARGLTQFVMPTALEVGQAVGLGRVAPDDLYRPEVAIALGAAYVGQLLRRFEGEQHRAVAAYNAGPPAAQLWRAWSYTDELPEYYTKVSFGETRNYLRKVLGSWSRYRDLYGTPASAP